MYIDEAWSVVSGEPNLPLCSVRSASGDVVFWYFQEELAAAVSSVESKVDGRLFSPSETGMALDNNPVSQGLGLDALLLASWGINHNCKWIGNSVSRRHFRKYRVRIKLGWTDNHFSQVEIMVGCKFGWVVLYNTAHCSARFHLIEVSGVRVWYVDIVLPRLVIEASKSHSLGNHSWPWKLE